VELNIVNAKPKYRPATLVEPAPLGYILLSADVEPPTGPRPFPAKSENRTALIGRLHSLANELERLDSVVKATVYRALLSPPPAGYAKTARHAARFDVITLVETTSPGAIADVETAGAYKQLAEELDGMANYLDIMRARCAKRIGDVDKTRPGLFLFNYFVAEEVDVALELWDYMAGWYMTETGLDNSTVLQPIGEAEYGFVNHARWSYGLPRLFLHQMTKPSFRSFVLANLEANRTGSMPILCRIA
jgi:hypothetical protein